MRFIVGAIMLLVIPAVWAMPAAVTSSRTIQANPYIDTTAADEQWAGKATMNGYRFENFRGFERWQLVTVRYRRDTGEMRFTYANPLAWATMREGRVNYPDGAIFAKFSAMTQNDVDFINSAVPSGKTRYQFMIRNAARHKETGGWGYVIFAADKLTMPGQPVAIANACNACHIMIPEKGYVFSEPMALTGANWHISRTELPAGRVPFTIVTTKSLPGGIGKYIPKDMKEVRLVQGPLSQHMFGGTLDEIRPTLLSEAKRTRHPAVLTNADGTLFSMAWPKSKAPCTNAAGQAGQMYETARAAVPNLKMEAIRGEYCW